MNNIGDDGSDGQYQDLIRELNKLDEEVVKIDGGQLKPSQCYRFETEPVHMMFNTNCPEDLKRRIESILERHIPGYENSSQE